MKQSSQNLRQCLQQALRRLFKFKGNFAHPLFILLEIGYLGNILFFFALFAAQCAEYRQFIYRIFANKRRGTNPSGK